MRLRKKISVLTAAVAASAALAVIPSGVAAPASAATPPSTTPSVPHSYYSAIGNFPACNSGHACADVKYGSGYYFFDFYRYGTYSLSHWLGLGSVDNLQTGGAAVRTYDNNGHQIKCLKPNSATFTFDWTPVWSIKLTASGC